MNIPNLLTLLRFFIIPFFGYYLYEGKYITAAVLFLVAGFTDVLDGFIARRYNMITKWGKLADPLADKLMQITALAILTVQHIIPLIVIIIVITKEIFMGIGSILLYRQDNLVLSASWYGKVATVVFYFAIVMSIFKEPYRDVFIIIAVVSTLFAFLMYFLTYRKIRIEYKNREQ